MNFPGSKKAVVECFEAIQSVLPHAIELIRDDKTKNVETHKEVQKDFIFQVPSAMTIDSSYSTATMASDRDRVQTVKPFKTSTVLDSSSSRNSEFSDISELLESSSSIMDEVKEELLKLIFTIRS